MKARLEFALYWYLFRALTTGIGYGRNGSWKMTSSISPFFRAVAAAWAACCRFCVALIEPCTNQFKIPSIFFVFANWLSICGLSSSPFGLIRWLKGTIINRSMIAWLALLFGTSFAAIQILNWEYSVNADEYRLRTFIVSLLPVNDLMSPSSNWSPLPGSVGVTKRTPSKPAKSGDATAPEALRFFRKVEMSAVSANPDLSWLSPPRTWRIAERATDLPSWPWPKTMYKCRSVLTPDRAESPVAIWK